MTYKSTAIVLHKTPFKESSFLVKLMTDTSGVVNAIVRGARRSNSPFFTQYELGNCLEVVIYKKDYSSLYTITDSCVKRFSNTKQSYDQFLSTQTVLELFSQLIIAEEESDDFFSLLLTYLDYIPNVKNNHLLIVWRFLIKLTELLGFPIMHLKDGKYILYEKVKGYLFEEWKSINDWLVILPNAGNYINKQNILTNNSIIQMNKLFIGWFNQNLNKKLHYQALMMYEKNIIDTLEISIVETHDCASETLGSPFI